MKFKDVFFRRTLLKSYQIHLLLHIRLDWNKRVKFTILSLYAHSLLYIWFFRQFWKITGCYWKIVNFLLAILTNNWLFSNSSLLFSKMISFRWQEENNRLLFSITGIDDQGITNKYENVCNWSTINKVLMIKNPLKTLL